MDRRAWWATVQESATRVRHDLETKPPTTTKQPPAWLPLLWAALAGYWDPPHTHGALRFAQAHYFSILANLQTLSPKHREGWCSVPHPPEATGPLGCPGDAHRLYQTPQTSLLSCSCVTSQYISVEPPELQGEEPWDSPLCSQWFFSNPSGITCLQEC